LNDITERLETMGTFWDDLCRHARDLAVPEWHRKIFAVREADLGAGQEAFVDWETAKQQLRDSCK